MRNDAPVAHAKRAAPAAGRSALTVRATRRGALRLLVTTAAGGVMLAAAGPSLAAPGPASRPAPGAVAQGAGGASDPLLAELGEQVRALLTEHQVPGAAVGLLVNGQPYAAGWGVTSVAYPQPVDASTIFQIGSVTKTFTGAGLALLMEQGQLDLDAPVRTYLPELALADPDVAARITLKHLVTHTAGFWGQAVPDGGRNDDALARMVPGLAELPQVTPLGRFFSYNNAAVSLAGRVLEVVAGLPYQDAIKALLLDPLGMDGSSFFLEDVVHYPVAQGHQPGPNGLMVERPYGAGELKRADAPTGNLLSNVNDLLRWCRFQLGDGTTMDGARLVAAETLALTHTAHGPGGSIGTFEIDGVGVNWLLRQVGGVRIVLHAGTMASHHAQLLLVPTRGFAFVLLCNGPGGGVVRRLLTDWVLEQYVGLRELPPPRIRVPAAEIAASTGTYGVRGLGAFLELLPDPDDAQLAAQPLDDRGAPDGPTTPFAFYAPDRLVAAAGDESGLRAELLRTDDGAVGWLRIGGRVLERL
jgi:CubicO group peptidase (beta-lactamase class C family)